MSTFLTRPKKILALKLRPLGESVLLSSSLEALKATFPDAQIHVAVTSTWAPLFVHHPAVSRIWPVDRHTDKLARAKGIARAALRLRPENFDCVLNFHASPSSATLAFAVGSKVRSIHFHSGRDKNRYSTVAIPDKGAIKSVLEKDFDCIRSLGGAPETGKYPPKIFLKPAEMDEGFKHLQSLELSRPILALGLGSSRPTKHWGASRFAELSALWLKEKSGSVLLITGPGEEERAAAVLHLVGQGARIAHLHAPDIRHLAAILSQCTGFVGNDSGIKHLAAASGIPTATLFGPEDPREWHVYPTHRHPYFFTEGLACRRDAQPGYPPWCSLESCVVEKHRCMQELDASMVFDSCRNWTS